MARHRKATKQTALAASVLRRRVVATLADSPAYRRLPRVRQLGLARDLAAVASFTGLARQVDFPDFVAGLIAGVFNSIVTTSIAQMEAYAALVANVVASVDRFTQDNVGQEGRDHLVATYPGIFEICADGTLALRGQCPGTGSTQARGASGARRRAKRKAPISAS